jgi:hypothetical protein
MRQMSEFSTWAGDAKTSCRPECVIYIEAARWAACRQAAEILAASIE